MEVLNQLIVYTYYRDLLWLYTIDGDITLDDARNIVESSLFRKLYVQDEKYKDSTIEKEIYALLQNRSDDIISLFKNCNQSERNNILFSILDNLNKKFLRVGSWNLIANKYEVKNEIMKVNIDLYKGLIIEGGNPIIKAPEWAEEIIEHVGLDLNTNIGIEVSAYLDDANDTDANKNDTFFILTDKDNNKIRLSLNKKSVFKTIGDQWYQLIKEYDAKNLGLIKEKEITVTKNCTDRKIKKEFIIEGFFPQKYTLDIY